MKIEADKNYSVKLTRVVQMGPFKYKPLDDIEMTGTMLKKIVDQEGEEAVDHARQL